MTRNEEATVEEAVRGVMPYRRRDHWSSMDIPPTAPARSRSRWAPAWSLDDGHGKGDGIRKAIEVAGGDVIVFIDADGSHDHRDIPSLTAPILAGEADLVVGSRWTGGSDELGGDIGKFIRSTGSSIITLAINYRWGVRLTDSQNGFRAISTKAGRAITLEENIFTIEQEMIMECLRHGFRVTETPTHEYKSDAGQLADRRLEGRPPLRLVPDQGSSEKEGLIS